MLSLSGANSDRSMEDAIAAYIIQEIVAGKGPLKLEADTPLLASEILDSLSLLKLVLFLEKQYGIAIGGMELVPENFETIGAICKFVRSRLKTKG